MSFKYLVLAALITVSGSAFAAAKTEAFPLNATSTTEFRSQANELRREMASGRYATLSLKEKRRVEKQLVALDDLYVKRGNGEQIKDADAVALVNASSEINSILAGSDGDRMICEQVRQVGSNRIQKVCMTASQREERRLEAQRDMREKNLGATRTSN